MDFLDLLIIGLGLAMDAFAVSICKGLSIPREDSRKAWIIAGYFAVFQMGMPLIGFLVGEQFSATVSRVDHWIAFICLGLIGGNMIRESLRPEEDQMNGDVSFRVMLPLAIATSIDALVTGVTFAFLSVNLATALLTIGLVTFGMCMAGVFLGRLAGARLGQRAQLLGGIVLILIGARILITHLSGMA